MLGQSPKGDKNANGEAETTVKSIKPKFRTIKIATEASIKRRIPSHAPVLKLMLKFAAHCISRY